MYEVIEYSFIERQMGVEGNTATTSTAHDSTKRENVRPNDVTSGPTMILPLQKNLWLPFHSLQRSILVPITNTKRVETKESLESTYHYPSETRMN